MQFKLMKSKNQYTNISICYCIVFCQKLYYVSCIWPWNLIQDWMANVDWKEIFAKIKKDPYIYFWSSKIS